MKQAGEPVRLIPLDSNAITATAHPANYWVPAYVDR